MILVFDLDDTLYDEITFVKSGFSKVADFVQNKYNIDNEKAYGIMLQELKSNGRGRVFDVLLDKCQLHSKKIVKQCLSVYRFHNPKISLNEDAKRCLERFETYKKYVVTDGNKVVQKNKVEALRLDQMVNKVYITHNYGLKNAKPSPYCFNKISKIEKKKPEEIVYIGDNPNKDFIEIKKLGYKTIRIKQGMFKSLELDKEHEAHITIQTLDQLTKILIQELHDKKLF